MNQAFFFVCQECCAGSLEGRLTFPQVIDKLNAIGVERYHADYSREEITYYFRDGLTCVVPAPHEVHVLGYAFEPEAVAAAVGESQRNEHSYQEFVRKTMEAGCVGYFVQLAGQMVIYFGRRGETHVELFPGAKAE